jgi:hypothetical protein
MIGPALRPEGVFRTLQLTVVQNEKKFTVKKGDVWACAKGITTEGTQNNGNVVAVMRIINLMTA